MDKPEQSMIPEDQRIETQIPETGDLRIPLWVKLMWLGGVAWVLWYIIFGLQSNPDQWAGL